MAGDLFLEAMIYQGDISGEGLDAGLSVGGLDDFRKSLNDLRDPVGQLFEKAELSTGSASSVDPGWSEPIGVEKHATPLGKTVAEHLGIVRYEDRIVDGQEWRFALNGADEVVKSRRIYA